MIFAPLRTNLSAERFPVAVIDTPDAVEDAFAEITIVPLLLVPAVVMEEIDAPDGILPPDIPIPTLRFVVVILVMFAELAVVLPVTETLPASVNLHNILTSKR